MINKFLAQTSSFVVLFPLLVSIIKFRFLQKELKIIVVHLLAIAIFELTSRILWVYKQNNLPLLHIYTIWELEILSFFYLKLSKAHLKKWIPVVMVCFLVFAIIDSLFFHDLQHFNVFARSVECLIIISYTIYYLYRQLLEGKNIALLSNPVMLINTAFLFYFSVSFFLFLFSNYIIVETLQTHIVWNMHVITAWILYTTIGIALWKAGRR